MRSPPTSDFETEVVCHQYPETLMDKGFQPLAPCTQRNNAEESRNFRNLYATSCPVIQLLADANGRVLKVKDLIDDGADPNIWDKSDKTALKYAKKRGFHEIVELLRMAGGFE